MLYVKANNDTVIKYPYTIGNLRQDNPGWCFPKDPSSECLVDFGAYKVQNTPSPEYNAHIEKLVENVELVDGVWTQTWVVENLPQELAEKNIRNERYRLLMQSDWRALNDQTLSPEWSAYRQALRDIPQQAGFPYSVNWPTEPS